MFLSDRNDISERDMIDFLKLIDNDFPIPLSQKVDLRRYTQKVLKDGTFVCYFENKSIKGIITGYTNDLESKKSYVSVLGIAPQMRGQSIGTKLLKRFEELALKNQMTTIYLHTHLSNELAIQFYIRNEYRIINTVDQTVTLEKKII